MSKSVRVIEPSHLALYSLVVVSLFFLVDVFDPFNLPKLGALVVMTLAAVGCWLGNKKVSFRDSWATRVVMDRIYLCALLAFAVVAVVAGLASTESKYHALWGNTGRNLGLIYFLCVVTLAFFVTTGNLRSLDLSLLNVIRTTTIPLAFYCLLQTFGLDPVPWQNPFDPMIGTLGNPNFSSGLLGALCGFFIFSVLLRIKYKERFIIELSLLILVLFLTLRNSSTQGRLLLLLSFVLVTLFALKRYMQKLSIYISVLAFLVMGFSFAVWSFLGKGPLGGILYQDTIVIRYEYWSVGIKSMLANPLMGLGVDSYAEGFRRFRSLEFANTRSLSVVSDNAHNALIQVGATFGIPAFLLVLTLFGVAFVRSFNILLRYQNVSRMQVSLAVMYILLLVQSLFSIEQIGLGVWIWILSAILMNPNFQVVNRDQVKDSKKKVVSDYGKNFGRELSFLFGAIALLIVVPRIQEDSNFGKLLISKIDGNTNPSTIDAKVEKFTGFTLQEPKRVIGVANAYFLANWNQKAVELLERVRLQDSNNWESRDALALAYGSLNQEDKAIEVRKEMEALDPNNWVNIFELANLYLKLGKEENARFYFEKVKAMSPSSPEGRKSIEKLLG